MVNYEIMTSELPNSTGNGDKAEPAFKTAAATVAQDWPRLTAYLARQGHDLDLSEAPRQFAGGFGNLNYLVTFNGEPAVLRRPPLGPIPPGANDMRRESRILSRLWEAFPLAPRCLYAGDEEAGLGACFFIMQYRPGLVIGGKWPTGLFSSDDRSLPGARLGQTLVETLAALHAVDPAAVALDDLGKPEGFFERTRLGCAKRAALAWRDEPPPALGELLHWLAAQAPRAGAPSLLHNDFKLDNLILDPSDLRPVAVVDWDMGTRGDPLFDLAVLLSYWTEAGDPPAMHRLQQMPTAGQGFPTREAVARAYGRLTGRDLGDFRPYRVLAILRLAVIFMQLNRRYREGGTADPRFESFGRLAEDILLFGQEVAAERLF